MLLPIPLGDFMDGLAGSCANWELCGFNLSVIPTPMAINLQPKFTLLNWKANCILDGRWVSTSWLSPTRHERFSSYPLITLGCITGIVLFFSVARSYTIYGNELISSMAFRFSRLSCRLPCSRRFR